MTGDRRATERQATAQEIDGLAAEVKARDESVATLLGRLADAVRQGRQDESRGYAEAIDPRATAELIVAKPASIWAILDVARNVIVFAPIAVTWYGLSTAATAYGALIGAQPALISRPFLLLWQQGFEGTPGVMPFSILAAIDASLIGVLIALSLLIHVRAELREGATRTKILLKESQIRGLIGHALTLASAELGAGESDAVLDAMVAEERRIYERAMEREQQLVDLGGAIKDLRTATEQLTRIAEAVDRRAAADPLGRR